MRKKRSLPLPFKSNFDDEEHVRRRDSGLSSPWRVNGRGSFHFRGRRVDLWAECALRHVGGGCGAGEAQKP
ncbi:hypothetical protein ES288_A04G149600v1 [Gossypium darwinii]|uniref:Uncharacterized protein n=1 Tax=Gossypium darwinii TaxID=34276 RepID=A0A5D2GZH2_GOSDA|nr:hypothetical protein ES288_A04G149600v1 [Gossypium darwinii]